MQQNEDWVTQQLLTGPRFLRELQKEEGKEKAGGEMPPPWCHLPAQLSEPESPPPAVQCPLSTSTTAPRG